MSHLIPNLSREKIKQMLKYIGVKRIDDLFKDIPEEIRFKGKLRIPGPFSEQDIAKRFSERLSHVIDPSKILCFRGGGVWPHYVPSVIDHIISRSELYTSYTPYQPEVSQGVLQALFEYQSLICELTGMDVANASMYDWATALAEACRMAIRVTRRDKIVIPSIIAPHRERVLRTYLEGLEIEIVKVNLNKNGTVDISKLSENVDSKTAAVYVESPTYMGVIEQNLDEIGEIAHKNGALFIVGVEPLSLAIFKPPGDYGADIVVGEGQPLGLGMNFGGSLLGIFACRFDRKLLYQMPGRIIGLTTEQDSARRAFCMVLQAREQHIRRERATSNICTNVALNAIKAAIYLSLLGRNGLRNVAKKIYANTHYAYRKLLELPFTESLFKDAVYFKEFPIMFKEVDIEEMNRVLYDDFNIIGGINLGRFFEDMANVALFCVTEIHSKRDIDYLAKAILEACEK